MGANIERVNGKKHPRIGAESNGACYDREVSKYYTNFGPVNVFDNRPS